MKYIWFLALSLALVVVACKKKAPELTAEQKEAKLQTQLDSIAKIKFDELVKEDLDTYPIFKGVCDTVSTKIGQKECFEKAFADQFSNRLKKASYQVTEPVTARIYLTIKVDNIGKIVLIDIEADDKTKELLATDGSSFEDSLRTQLAALTEEDNITPATKNGQNVGTQFRLPIEINVK